MPRLKKPAAKKIRSKSAITAAGRKRLIATLQGFHRWHCYANATVLARDAMISEQAAADELECMAREEKLDKITVSYLHPDGEAVAIQEDCYQLPSPKPVRKSLEQLYFDIEGGCPSSAVKPKKRRRSK